MTTFVNIRIFSHPCRGDSGREHSYYVGQEVRGLSERLDMLAIDPKSTFVKLRELIEEQCHENGNVMRRRRFYTDFLHFMRDAPNPLGYEGKDLKKYRIGTLRMSREKGVTHNARDIKLVREEFEVKRICDIVDDLLETDIVLVPTTQIHPTTARISDQL